MASDFTDLTALVTTPMKGHDKQLKKRGALSGRLRLMPLGDSSTAMNYEMNNNNNSSNNNNNSSASKLKKITQKKELIEAVRKANSPIVLPGRDTGGMMSSLRSLNNDGGSFASPSTSTPEADPGQKDLECLEDGVHQNARKFNEHKLMVDRRQRELNSLLDELRALQLETQELSRMQNQETPISKQNIRIKKEIGECTTAMEEQMHVRRQLEHMIRRLQTNQLRVDAQILTMSKAVDNSIQEAEEVKLLCRQLEAGKSRAVQALQDVQLQFQMERKARARELCDHEIRAKNAQKMEAWRVQRAHERSEMAAELRGDMSADEEARLLRNIESRERANEALHVANLTKSQKAADYDELLDQLKLAMGANSLREVVEKMNGQATTTSSLEKEKGQAEMRLSTARLEKEQALQTLNELKASGIGGIELNREVYNTLENEIQQAKATLKVNKAAYERLDGVISAVRQGSYGLAQRLQAFDDVVDINGSSIAADIDYDPSLLNGTSGASISSMLLPPRGGEHTDSLVIAELKLAKMLEIIGQQSSSVNGFSGFDGDEVFEDGSARPDLLDERNAVWSPTANNDPVLHQNNIRVRPNTHQQAYVFGSRYDQSPAIDSARSDRSDTSDNIEVLIPSRDILKMSSSRHFSEVMRKKEMDEKQRVAAEKGISDEEMMSKLRKRNQLETDARLATSPTRANNARVKGAQDAFAFVTQLHFNDL